MNWSRWYLPNINVTDSIKYLDDYFIQCIRYLYTGHWNKGDKHFVLSYDKIKELGFISLVNIYYKIKKAKKLQIKRLKCILYYVGKYFNSTLC